jgi:hypothetical protein
MALTWLINEQVVYIDKLEHHSETKRNQLLIFMGTDKSPKYT